MLDQLLVFFENLEAWQKLLWIFLCLSFNFILEALIPLVKNDYNKLKHFGVNLFFLISDLLINLIFGILTVGIVIFVAQANFGLFYLLSFPNWLELILSIMALDLIAQYLVHFALHKIPFLWKFHMIHHSDTHVDASTGTRHHPGDYLTREIGSLFAILVLGIPMAYYIIYRILTILFTYFSHANISLPVWLDRSINWVFVSPNMHKFHHHFEAPWTDSNYGNIFSIWDRIFGTLVYDDPKKIVYGLDILNGDKDEDILFQLKIPFDSRIKSKGKINH